MSMVTSQQLTHYFEQYGQTEVTFTKQVISATGLVARGVYLKLVDRQLPCVVFSSSMCGAKVIAGMKAAFFTALRQTGNKLSLRWCFKVPQETEPIMFYASCHAAGFTPYNPENPDLQLITLEYTQRPPDDLIMILGGLLDATANFKRRKDERILMNPESMKKMGIETRDAVLSINGRHHRGVLRDLSFGGAKVLMPSMPRNVEGSTVTLKIAKGEEQTGELFLLGVIRRVEQVGGRTDISIVGVEYVREPPLSYKMLINSYLGSQRKPGTESAVKSATEGADAERPAWETPAAEAPAPHSATADFPEAEEEADVSVEDPSKET